MNNIKPITINITKNLTLSVLNANPNDLTQYDDKSYKFVFRRPAMYENSDLHMSFDTHGTKNIGTNNEFIIPESLTAGNKLGMQIYFVDNQGRRSEYSTQLIFTFRDSYDHEGNHQCHCDCDTFPSDLNKLYYKAFTNAVVDENDVVFYNMYRKEVDRITIQGGIGTIVDTDHVLISEDIEVIGTTYGDLVDGDIIPKDTTMTDYIKMGVQKTIKPIYEAPLLNITSNVINRAEVGTNINSTITTLWVQNDAGSLTNFKVYKDNIVIYTGNSITNVPLTPFSLTETITNIKSEVTYDEGEIKNDNRGNPSPEGHILAGTIQSNVISFSGYRNCFADSLDILITPTTSDEIRDFSGVINDIEKGDKFKLICNINDYTVCIAYPQSLGDITAIQYEEQGNDEYKELFNLSVVNVEGANGSSAIPYNVYTWQSLIPLPSTMTFNVTI